MLVVFPATRNEPFAGGDFKPTAVYDMASYMRMEQEHGKGIMSDPTFRREYLRDNPECKLD